MSVTQPPSQSLTTSFRTVEQTTSLTANATATVFGQVMGLVALTVGCAALGAYIGRERSGGAGLLFFIGAFACIFGLNAAATRGRSSWRSAFSSALVCYSGWPSHPSSPRMRKPTRRRFGRPPARQERSSPCSAPPVTRHGGTCDLRWLHGDRLQPDTPSGIGGCGTHRCQHLPRHLQRVPVHVGAVRRRSPVTAASHLDRPRCWSINPVGHMPADGSAA